MKRAKLDSRAASPNIPGSAISRAAAAHSAAGIFRRLRMKTQIAAVKALAQREGRSMADVVRESVETHLRSGGVIDREALKARALAAMGRFRSGVTDLGKDHDRHAVEAFAE